MSRKIISAALALTVAGGVYLAAPSVEASNMGFKLERSFDLLREPGGTPFLNYYLLSPPLFNGLGDVANDQPGSPANKCVGDVDGPPAPDGIVNAADLICDAWTSRLGSFQVQRFDRDACSVSVRTATRGGFGISFSGGFTQPLEPGIGYAIQISVPAGSPVTPLNRAVIVGSHDPSYPGRQIIPGPACMGAAVRRDLVALPYHTMYRTANEMLCGLEGVDWVDVDAFPGEPDDCPNGTLPENLGIPYDNRTALQVQTYDNEVARGYQVRTMVFQNLGMRDDASGTNFQLKPGDAYFFVVQPVHLPTTFLSPHF